MTDPVISKIEGQCLCGAVQITVRDMKPLIDVCHCAMCRKWGGGPFFGMQGVSHEITGEEHVTTFKSSDWAERASCGKCGSNLYYRFLPTGHTSFLAGLFDLPESVTFEQQIFVDEKPPFYDFAQATPMKTGADVIAEASSQLSAAGISFGD